MSRERIDVLTDCPRIGVTGLLVIPFHWMPVKPDRAKVRWEYDGNTMIVTPTNNRHDLHLSKYHGRYSFKIDQDFQYVFSAYNHPSRELPYGRFVFTKKV